MHAPGVLTWVLKAHHQHGVWGSEAVWRCVAVGAALLLVQAAGRGRWHLCHLLGQTLGGSCWCWSQLVACCCCWCVALQCTSSAALEYTTCVALQCSTSAALQHTTHVGAALLLLVWSMQGCINTHLYHLVSSAGPLHATHQLRSEPLGDSCAALTHNNLTLYTRAAGDSMSGCGTFASFACARKLLSGLVHVHQVCYPTAHNSILCAGTSAVLLRASDQVLLMAAVVCVTKWSTW
jgi:hypothetical protein